MRWERAERPQPLQLAREVLRDLVRERAAHALEGDGEVVDLRGVTPDETRHRGSPGVELVAGDDETDPRAPAGLPSPMRGISITSSKRSK